MKNSLTYDSISIENPIEKIISSNDELIQEDDFESKK